ncbi:MAG TPA: 4Fe-4S dicluster domain-containing protein [Anaeromyxobacteraceae bacterium]|nr:4Fe-4S dicluster domain-containing protein [Anaeromyxobacteraceae bacterium]
MSHRDNLPVVQEGSAEAGPAAEWSRRRFMQAGAAAAAVAAAAGCKPASVVEELRRRNFKELKPDDLKALLQRLERKYSEEYGKPVTVSAPPPMPGVNFGYGLDLSRCIGCRRCVYACVKENNQSRKHPQIQWIRVLQMDKEHGVDLTHANPYYNPELVPEPGHFYMPTQCQQCRHPPCTKVCPVKATWKEPDGIVVIDYDWCIGCRCCTAACPYGARKFNWAEPELPAAEMNPVTAYLGNRPRPKGVVEKCTFCIQRSRVGRYPACVEICPVGARKFGNLLDPASEIRQVMDRKRVFVFKEELATEPQFYYFYAT